MVARVFSTSWAAVVVTADVAGFHVISSQVMGVILLGYFGAFVRVVVVCCDVVIKINDGFMC